jgi:hypothetical protein
MDAVETETIERDGQTYRIRIFHDPDAPNPLEDWSEMGTILSLSRRHANHISTGVDDLLDNNPDAMPLSYFEHGRCLWCVAGELPPGADCRWDSVGIAGFWLPDAVTLASARHYGGWTRRQFMRKRARQACDAYSQWCNGDVYGYEIERITVCGCCGEEKAESVDSCWGFYGLDYFLSEATAAIPCEC